MRRSSHTDAEILHLLHEAQAGVPIDDLCRTHGISRRTFFRWRARFGGMTTGAAREVKDLQLEVQRLRALVCVLSTRSVADMMRMQRESRPRGVRAEQGCDSAGPPGSMNPAGASLGRFAFVRGHR